jgi:hypothetical protein
MRAFRILALARTIRWASAGGWTRNALAISSVVRPQTVRSVSAICASSARAGWQQVKISRSWSSSTRSSSNAGASVPPVSNRAANSPSEASNRARRRMVSMPLKRPAETSHARGLAGMASGVHCSSAAVKASWSASSARSKSPSSRIRVARTRRESER